SPASPPARRRKPPHDRNLPSPQGRVRTTGRIRSLRGRGAVTAEPLRSLLLIGRFGNEHLTQPPTVDVPGFRGGRVGAVVREGRGVRAAREGQLQRPDRVRGERGRGHLGRGFRRHGGARRGGQGRG